MYSEYLSDFKKFFYFTLKKKIFVAKIQSAGWCEITSGRETRTF